MEIKIVRSDVLRSRIITEKTTDVRELPPGLKSLMKSLLSPLSRAGIKGISIDGSPKKAIFESSKTNATFNCLKKKAKKTFLDVIGLLIWYLNPHWGGASGDKIGGVVCCVDCHSSRVIGGSLYYCGCPSCPSHEKWRKVIGPSYKKPKNFIPLEDILKELDLGLGKDQEKGGLIITKRGNRAWKRKLIY